MRDQVSWRAGNQPEDAIPQKPEMCYTLRTNQMTRAITMIVPRMPPMYIQISVNGSESSLAHTQVSLSGRYRTQERTTLGDRWRGSMPCL
jgi:hypothetical protein